MNDMTQTNHHINTWENDELKQINIGDFFNIA